MWICSFICLDNPKSKHESKPNHMSATEKALLHLESLNCMNSDLPHFRYNKPHSRQYPDDLLHIPAATGTC